MNKNSLKINKTAAEIAEMVEGRLEGDGSLAIQVVASLEQAGSDAISFLGNPKYAEAAQISKAGCLLLPLSAQGFTCLARSRIYVEDPQYAFSQILIAIESSFPKPPALVDNRASVHYEARLGPDVIVGAFSVIERGAIVGKQTTIASNCYIGAGARVGQNCRIYPNVVIRENCEVGDRAIIHSGAVIGSDGFGFSTDRKTGKHRKIPQLGNVVIGDDVEMGANAAIDRATIGSTLIGSGTKIDNLVHLAHNVQIGKDCLILALTGVAGSTNIGDRVILAAQAGVAGHLNVGDGAIIMAQSGIMSDVEKGAILFGSPARPRREAFKLQALYGRLPEFFDTLKKIKRQFGVSVPDSAQNENSAS
jgi:UDP-3-O-[3-hydroxymyristoyl] glucosamine N-acyltransferase